MNQVEKRQARPEKETIHSGHFMVSHFEAEAQDDFDDLVSVPDEEQNVPKVSVVATYPVPGIVKPFPPTERDESKQQLSIEVSLTKLFKCMSLAYRQKLTSPKWNRFKGIKLRWKDKIRLNNVIWRCWHMQFIKKQNTLVCQFASPLDVDTHVKPETTILEGKYWKRRAEAVIAEYKKWRKFHIMRLLGKGDSLTQDTVSDMDTVESFSQCSDLAMNMLTDEDYLNFMTDTLFSTITSHQPFAFPDCREIAREAGLADFIQPSLGPLQPNLDDVMDTFEPLHDLLSTPRLPPVPEESALPEPMYRALPDYAPPYSNAAPPSHTHSHHNIHGTTSNTQMMPISEQGINIKNEQMRVYENYPMFGQTDIQTNMITQELLPPITYENQTDQPMTSVYNKQQRVQFVNTPKVVQNEQYNKYNAGYDLYLISPKRNERDRRHVPPSATAPETVSLLQGAGKYSPRAPRDKPRARPHQHPHPHYNVQNNHYYNQSVPQPYEPRGPYPAEYKQKSSRAFKMPSPPAAPAPPPCSPQQLQAASSSREQFRSHSLPLGAQLNADWTVTAPPDAARAPRARSPGAARPRSRSSSGGAEAARGAARRRPPPLHSVASEPALPQANIMLAQLLSAKHSQSLYKLSSPEEAGEASPATRGQPSPIGSDVMSPHQSLSPPLSPSSERAGSPRRSHLHAEQKRRYNIKNGFDTLQALIPHLNTNPAAKISKAAMLQKGAEYIKQLKAERNQIKEEMDSLRQQIECLNNSISNCHSLLPATGAPVSRARAGRLREMFARHVAHRTTHNWKYWLFSVVAAALVESFSACVSHGSGADLARTTLLWAEQHCSLVEMRPAVLNSLRVLCTSTDILSSPERLPDEARAAAAHAHHHVKQEPT